ncbi:MAG: bifunctional acetate--CoA ligase family protein/GNAT family N-acetyltransferase [Pseudoxanthomonas sp.]
MSTYRLQSVFQPQSVAVVGGSPRERSAGRAVVRNLRASGFAGKLAWVSPHYNEIDGIATVSRISSLPWKPDLVVVTTPVAIVPKVIAEAAAHGAGAAVVLTAINDAKLAAKIEAAAREHGMRILGPHCLGVIAPYFNLNASIAARTPPPGDLALVSQSSAIAAALVEWSATRDVGFSAVVALGDAVDVDFADLLDHFATDYRTRAILLYVERIKNARKFMSAARAAARAKPVVVVKSNRRGPPPSFDEVGMRTLAPRDAVYAAAFRRAGLLQVDTLDELFAAAETLGRLHTFPGRRLAILGNGGGVGALALDQLQRLGGTAAELSAGTVEKLDKLLPDGWSRENPVDIVVDADGGRYARAIEALLADDKNDALMVINVPTAFTSSAEAAQGLAATLAKKTKNKPVFAVWLGQDEATQTALNAARVPSYASESDAIHGFMHLVHYREAQTALMETPPSLPQGFVPDVETARAIVSEALENGGGQLSAEATQRLLTAYDIPVTPLQFAADADAAACIAEPLLATGKTVVVKIHSPDIAHKASVNGVRLDLDSVQAVREATCDVLRNAREKRPDARIDGVVVQAMEHRPEARELIIVIADDPLFGPVIVFGRGGTAVRVVDDLALALPPLDLRLAHELIGRTRISRRLHAYRGMSAVDQRNIALVLVKLAQLAADLPEIKQLSLNPLLADPDGVVAVDARAIVESMPALHKGRGHPRFAIFPYPQEWERHVDLDDGARMFVRPVRPEDDALFREFFTHVSDEDLRLRFFQSVKHFSHEFIARLTQMDYARSIALVALDAEGDMLGAVRLMADANYEKGEYGILVRSDLKGHGIGWRLMTIMIEYAGWLGLREVDGKVLRENRGMLAMCKQLGFDIKPDPDDPGLMDVRLPVGKTS